MSDLRGQRVKHSINGLEGIVTAQTRYLAGCEQVCIMPCTLDKDGDRRDVAWVDVAMVTVLDPVPIALPEAADLAAATPPGGPARTHGRG